MVHVEILKCDATPWACDFYAYQLLKGFTDKLELA